MLDYLLSLFKFLGYIKLLEILYRLLWLLRRQFRSTNHLPRLYGKGTYALVTGGSDGIGLALCKELAFQGFNIIIVSRNAEKMLEAS